MQPSGFLIINKPKGITSHDVIDILRKKTGQKKIGHAGTLDPMATGVLICGINKATKRLSEFMELEKEYQATIELGKISDTYDAEGVIKRVDFESEPSVSDVEEVIKGFIGEIDQLPPAFSAKKIKGKKMYELARKGIEIKRKPQRIKIHSIKIDDYQFPFLKIQVVCSKGTYIRSLADDIGRELKTGGYLRELIRTRIGDIKLNESITLDNVKVDNWESLCGRYRS